jgi:hypothetical protein
MGSYRIPDHEVTVLTISSYLTLLMGICGVVFSGRQIRGFHWMKLSHQTSSSNLELRDLIIFISFVGILGESINGLLTIHTSHFPEVYMYPVYYSLRVLFLSHLPGNYLLILILRLQVILFSSAKLRKFMFKLSCIVHLLVTPVAIYAMYDHAHHIEDIGWQKPSEIPVLVSVTSIFFVIGTIASFQSLRIAFQNPNGINDSKKTLPSITESTKSSSALNIAGERGIASKSPIKTVANSSQSTIQLSLNWNFKVLTFSSIVTWVLFLTLSLVLPKFVTHLTRFRLTQLFTIPGFLIEAIFRNLVKHRPGTSKASINKDAATFAIEESVLIPE